MCIHVFHIYVYWERSRDTAAPRCFLRSGCHGEMLVFLQLFAFGLLSWLASGHFWAGLSFLGIAFADDFRPCLGVGTCGGTVSHLCFTMWPRKFTLLGPIGCKARSRWANSRSRWERSRSRWANHRSPWSAKGPRLEAAWSQSMVNTSQNRGSSNQLIFGDLFAKWAQIGFKMT